MTFSLLNSQKRTTTTVCNSYIYIYVPIFSLVHKSSTSVTIFSLVGTVRIAATNKYPQVELVNST
jgi:hypothetical protein